MSTRNIAVIMLVSVSTPAYAQFSRPDAAALVDNSYQAMEQFARCSETFRLGAELAELMGTPARSQELLGVSRGAEAAALFSAYMSAADGDPAVGDLQFWIQTRRRQVETFQELERMSIASKIESDTWNGEDLEYCATLQPLQQALIDVMREVGMM